MGNVYSIISSRRNNETTSISETEQMDFPSGSNENQGHDNNDHAQNATIDERAKAKEKEMDTFMKQLSMKREQRREILTRHREEKEELKQCLVNERKSCADLLKQNRIIRELLSTNKIEVPEEVKIALEEDQFVNELESLKNELDVLKTNNMKLRRDLAESNYSLQNAYSDMADLSQQNTESIKQINALKEVIAISKTLIGLREQQLNELKNKLNEIEKSLADREANMLSTDLRNEYERQLKNIRTLRSLYEERARLAEVTRQGLIRELEEQKAINQVETNKCSEYTSKVAELNEQIGKLKQDIEAKEEYVRSLQVETRGLKEEMTVVNKLFAQVLLGYKSERDLDMLVRRLQENHALLAKMAETDDGSEVSIALPKMLLELVSQVDEEIVDINEPTKEGTDADPATSAAKIVENLPKVWKVLIELLSHQTPCEPTIEPKVTTCYKSVETSSGPVLVPSVSQTYIRLKDLIMEKLTLIKEVNRMKQLNTHLENRLGEQERRLCIVTTELSKTWHVVGRLRRHHHQLHTHEKILKYELQQKRKLLNELKEELEYCKEKWTQAREKNSQSEKDWRKLRTELSNRKMKLLASCNNSAESGYSDERPSDDSSESNDDSDSYMNEQTMVNTKKNKSSNNTVIDSSTDHHIAEREDPVSDMLDVAELPLDSQEGEEHFESTLKDLKDTIVLTREKSITESEDEYYDTGNDCSIEEIPGVQREDSVRKTIKSDAILTKPSSSQKYGNTVQSNEHSNTVNPTIDTKAILDSIKRQNERLAKRDQRLNTLEEGCKITIKKLSTVIDNSDLISLKLDTLQRSESSCVNEFQRDYNKPSTSKIFPAEDASPMKDVNTDPFNETPIEKESPDNNGTATDTISHNPSLNSGPQTLHVKPDTSKHSSLNITPTIDTKAILESIKVQNEFLAKKDLRLNKLEEGSASVVNVLNTTIENSTLISRKLDKLQKNEATFSKCSEITVTNDEVLEAHQNNATTQNTDIGAGNINEPSTSSLAKANETVASKIPFDESETNDVDVNHEARFAARDIRLKRLEEQTKSLVKRVNKTTSKGVKINYKLEELHNIYGSESSRAGTPFDENESNDDDESINES